MAIGVKTISGGTSLDDINALRSQVCKGYTAYTNDGGEDAAVEGTAEEWDLEYELPTSFLCLTASGVGNTVKLVKTENDVATLTPSFQYLKDNETEWKTLEPTPYGSSDSNSGTTIELTSGQSIYIRGKNLTGISESKKVYYSFVLTGSIAASGNVMSLINNGIGPADTIPNEYCFYRLFSNAGGAEVPTETLTALTSAPELTATNLQDTCYQDIFRGCINLTTAPELPARVMKAGCYAGMFMNCLKLAIAPELPAEELDVACYSNMFAGCYSLETAPELPADIVKNSSYKLMFAGCKKLKSVPDLKATTLSESSYESMFLRCVALVTAPEILATTVGLRSCAGMFSECELLLNPPSKLPAMTLLESCYAAMFMQCYSLLYTPLLPATTLANACYALMFLACISLVSVPALPATYWNPLCYQQIFYGCMSLIISDTSGTSYTNAYKIPTSEQITGGSGQSHSFTGCIGGDRQPIQNGHITGVTTKYTLLPVGTQNLAEIPENSSEDYTGSEIISYYKYDSQRVEITAGIDRGTNVGTYTATYSLKTGYTWSDGTTDSKTVTLTIKPVYIWERYNVLGYEDAAQSVKIPAGGNRTDILERNAYAYLLLNSGVTFNTTTGKYKVTVNSESLTGPVNIGEYGAISSPNSALMPGNTTSVDSYVFPITSTTKVTFLALLGAVINDESSEITAIRRKANATGHGSKRYTDTYSSNPLEYPNNYAQDGIWYIKVVKPTDKTATYTGSVISNGVSSHAAINMTGNDRGIEVGTYTATYTPKSNGYLWSDGTSDAVTVMLTITEA